MIIVMIVENSDVDFADIFYSQDSCKLQSKLQVIRYDSNEGIFISNFIDFSI